MEDKKIFVARFAKIPNCYPSITEALNSIPEDNNEPVTICIAPGTYREKITINKPFVTLKGVGKSNEDTVITYSDYANKDMDDGMKMGTFRSYSVFIDAHDVTFQNLTIENASGDSVTHGQALALYADGDRIIVDSCRLIGHQDTLFTGPLPPKEVQKNGFIGPKQYAPRINGRHYYKNCYICGDVDFIFGSATAYFESCTIESLKRFDDEAEQNGEDVSKKVETETKIQGYVTAASTPEGQEYGYVFSKCDIISKDCKENTVYLGRPWREYAKTVFMDCSFGKHIRPELFHDWNKENARKTVFYAVYNCMYEVEGESAIAVDSSLMSDESVLFPCKADFVQELNKEQTAAFTKERVLCGEDGWLPD
ncbi:MAG: pectinesterase family protein [Clostridiales bacterium]|nr:pectinesterase family protein [Clostridiales bacterium]